MPRKRKAVVREVLPDPKYNDVVLTKFMNCLMVQGKKSLAEKIVYGAFDIIQQKTKQDPLEVFKTALENVRPGESGFPPRRWFKLSDPYRSE
jgi:small subunit ribosomal protein S7